MNHGLPRICTDFKAFLHTPEAETLGVAIIIAVCLISVFYYWKNL